MASPRRIVLVIIASFCVAVAIGSIFFPHGGGESPTAAPAEGLVEVDLVDQDKRPLSLFGHLDELLQKNDAVLVNFWATWCEPCVEEMPLILKSLPKLHEKKIAVLLINSDGGDSTRVIPEVKAWLISQRLNGLENYFDPSEKLVNHLGVSGLPFTLKIVKGRKIAWKKLGELNWKELDFLAE